MMCSNEMSLKWKIIIGIQRRFNRGHTTHAEMYYHYIVVPRELKGSMIGVHVDSVIPAVCM